MASTTSQLNNEAVSLIKLEKHQEALSLLNKALLKGSSSKRVPQRSSFRSLVSFVDEDSEDSARIEILYSSQAQFEFDGECDEGMRTFNSILDIFVNGDDDWCYDEDPVDQIIVDAVVYYNLGILMTRLNQDEEAFSYFQKSLSNKNSYSSFVNKAKFGFFEIANLHNLGHINYRNGKYEEALSKYRTALLLAEEFFDRNHVDTAISLNCIGVVIMQMTQGSDDGTQEALFHFCEALIIIHNVDEEQHHDDLGKIAATIMNNIGRVRVLRGELEEALSMYDKALRIRISLFGEDHLNTVAINFNMAEAFHLSGNTDEALGMLHKFLSVASPHLGDDHIAVLNILAEAYIDCEEFEKAAGLYQKALTKLQSSKPPIDQEEVAKMMNALGNILYHIGDSDAALKVSRTQSIQHTNCSHMISHNINNISKMYKDGLALERQLYDPNDDKIAVTLLNMARVYHHEGKFRRAFKMYEAGAQMQRQAEETDPLKLASTLDSLGLVANKIGLLDESKEAYQEALLPQVEELGNNHFDVSATLNSLGLVNFKLKLYRQALENFEHCLTIRHQLCEPRDSTISPILYNIAIVQIEIGNSSEAFNTFQEYLDIEFGDADEDNSERITTLKRIGQIYEKKDETKCALYYYKQAIQHCYLDDSEITCNYVEVASLYDMMGKILLKTHNVDGAFIMFANAHRAHLVSSCTNETKVSQI